MSLKDRINSNINFSQNMTNFNNESADLALDKKYDGYVPQGSQINDTFGPALYQSTPSGMISGLKGFGKGAIAGGLGGAALGGLAGGIASGGNSSSALAGAAVGGLYGGMGGGILGDVLQVRSDYNKSLPPKINLEKYYAFRSNILDKTTLLNPFGSMTRVEAREEFPEAQRILKGSTVLALSGSNFRQE